MKPRKETITMAEKKNEFTLPTADQLAQAHEHLRQFVARHQYVANLADALPALVSVARTAELYERQAAGAQAEYDQWTTKRAEAKTGHEQAIATMQAEAETKSKAIADQHAAEQRDLDVLRAETTEARAQLERITAAIAEAKAKIGV